MALAESAPSVAVADSPFGAVVARQLSVWPFAARTQRLFVMVDPSLNEPRLRDGVIRAMQQAYFRSDGSSQTRAVREAALAAHYVLRHRNRDVLPADHISAATAVAAVRGDRAYVALAGDAAAFAYRDGALTGQRGIVRLARPLGLESEPRIELWSSPLRAGDRLALVCGAVWTPDSVKVVEETLAEAVEPVVAEQRLGEALGAGRPPGVLVIDGARPGVVERRLRLVPAGAPRPPAAAASDAGRPLRGGTASRWLSPLVALALLGAAAAIAFSAPGSATPRAAALQQARVLVEQATQTPDPYAAHRLVVTALDLTRGVAAATPGEYTDIIAQLATRLDVIDRVYAVTPAMAVRLGPSGTNVVDLAVGDDRLYTLDVSEGSVRAFPVAARDQQPTPETLLLRAGTSAAPGDRPLATPVAIQYLGGALTVIDQARSVFQVDAAHAISQRQVPQSGSWLELGALGTDPSGRLFVLDNRTRRLMGYELQPQRPVDPPHTVLDALSAPGLNFDQAAEIVGFDDGILVRLDNGALQRFDMTGGEVPIRVRPPDERPGRVQGIASDRAGGVYLADPTHARILHTTADGAFIRQLRDPALGGLRQIQTSPDGQRLYGLVTAGVLVIDLPPGPPASPILWAGTTDDADPGH